MTLPKDVAEALAVLEGEAVCTCSVEYKSRGTKDPSCNHDLIWVSGAIRTHLLSQDAEIVRLREYVRDADRRVGAQFMAAQTAAEESLRRLNACGVAHRAKRAAESRLAAANALLLNLRERFDRINRDDDGDVYINVSCDAMDEIDAHLQGAGDE